MIYEKWLIQKSIPLLHNTKLVVNNENNYIFTLEWILLFKLKQSKHVES